MAGLNITPAAPDNNVQGQASNRANRVAVPATAKQMEFTPEVVTALNSIADNSRDEETYSGSPKANVKTVSELVSAIEENLVRDKL